MIPIKDARKILYITTSAKTLADFQAMFASVVAVTLLCESMGGDYIYSVEFSPEVDGLTVLSGGSAYINLPNGQGYGATEFAEGAKIPFYFITYIND